MPTPEMRRPRLPPREHGCFVDDQHLASPIINTNLDPRFDSPMNNIAVPQWIVRNESGNPLTASLWAVRGLFFLNGFLYATWATRIPAIQSQFQLSHAALGVALMMVALGAVVAMPTAGWLCSRWGSRRVVAISLLLYIAGLPLVALMPSLTALFIALLLFGVGHGMLDVSMNVQAVEVERRWQRPINSSIHALWSVGGLSGAIAGSVIGLWGLAAGLHFALVSAFLSLAVVPIVTRLLTESSTAVSDARDEETGAPSQPRGRNRALLLLGAIAFCIMAGEGAMADWSAVLLNQVLGVSEGLAATGYATFAIAMAAGRFAGDRLSMRLGPMNQVRISGLVALAGLLIVVTSSHLALALLGFALIGGGFATIVPAVFSACGRLDNIPAGVALATVSTIGYFGFLLGPPLIGFVAELLSLRIALGCLSVTTLASVLLATTLAPRTPATETSQHDRCAA